MQRSAILSNALFLGIVFRGWARIWGLIDMHIVQMAANMECNKYCEASKRPAGKAYSVRSLLMYREAYF